MDATKRHANTLQTKQPAEILGYIDYLDRLVSEDADHQAVPGLRPDKALGRNNTEGVKTPRQFKPDLQFLCGLQTGSRLGAADVDTKLPEGAGIAHPLCETAQRSSFPLLAIDQNELSRLSMVDGLLAEFGRDGNPLLLDRARNVPNRVQRETRPVTVR